MFTGIIEELGTVRALTARSGGKKISIDAKITLEGIEVGSSIAVNGVCLTVTEMDNTSFSAYISQETLNTTTFGKLRVGEKVNLERPMRFSDRLGGHLVTGHVDATGYIRGVTRRGEVSIFTIEVPVHILPYIVPKGSVSVDGISLTVNDIKSNRFTVAIIPHTAQMTTLGFKKIGDSVNIETDIIGKYVERFVSRRE